jgi:hypothetical protein
VPSREERRWQHHRATNMSTTPIVAAGASTVRRWPSSLATLVLQKGLLLTTSGQSRGFGLPPPPVCSETEPGERSGYAGSAGADLLRAGLRLRSNRRVNRLKQTTSPGKRASGFWREDRGDRLVIALRHQPVIVGPSRSRLCYCQAPSIQLSSIELADGFLGSAFLCHLNKAKAAGTTRHAVRDNTDRDDFSHL